MDRQRQQKDHKCDDDSSNIQIFQSYLFFSAVVIVCLYGKIVRSSGLPRYTDTSVTGTSVNQAWSHGGPGGEISLETSRGQAPQGDESLEGPSSFIADEDSQYHGPKRGVNFPLSAERWRRIETAGSATRSRSKKRRKERKGEGEGFDLHEREADCTADQFTGRDESGTVGEGEFIDFSRQVIVRN